MPDSYIVGIVNGLENSVSCHPQLSPLCIKFVICLSPPRVIGNIMSNEQTRHVGTLQVDRASREFPKHQSTGPREDRPESRGPAALFRLMLDVCSWSLNLIAVQSGARRRYPMPV